MIIKGKSRGAAAQAASYLLAKGKNEKIRFIEAKETASFDVKNAVKEMAAIAALSCCKNFLYHASINPKEGESLTSEQWQQAVDTLEKNLGLEGHQRIVVEHVKDGRAHRHILWNRVDQENFKAVRMSHSYPKHEKTARHLEKEFGLDHVQGVHVFEKNALQGKEHGPTHGEHCQSKKTGVNLWTWWKEIRELADQVEGMTGADLVALLESQGHMVAKGDKVAFVLLDPSGTPQRMAQGLGMSVKDLKEKLSDVENVPHVEQARERQKEVLGKQERQKEEQAKARAVRLGAGMYDRGGMASQQKDALRHVKDKGKLKEKTQQKQFKRIMQHEEEKKQQAAEQKIQQPQTAKRPTQAQARIIEKTARTEQTDSKQRSAGRDIMKEYSDRYTPTKEEEQNSLSKGGGGRERER